MEGRQADTCMGRMLPALIMFAISYHTESHFFMPVSDYGCDGSSDYNLSQGPCW